MSRLKQFTGTIVILLSLILCSAVPQAPVHAVDILSAGCTGNEQSAVCQSKSDSATTNAKTVINIILYVLGIIAIIMIIIGGIKYVISNGDSSAVQSAKNTIMYAVVGLMVAIMSFAIVNFLLDRIK